MQDEVFGVCPPCVYVAQLTFNSAVAAISIVDTDYVHGTLPLMNPLSAPRGEAMCSHTILMKTYV